MPKRLSLIVFAVIAGLLQVGPAAAQAPSAEQSAAARDLVIIMRASDTLKNMFPLIMNALRPAIVQNRPEVAKDFDALMPGVLRLMESRSEGFVAAVATVYARNFTVAQLRDITSFYKTPTGQAMLEKQTVLAQESLEVGQRFAQSLAGELQNQIKDELRKKGHNI